MAGIHSRGSHADGDAVAVNLFAPMHDVVLGDAHGVVDAALVHGAHLAVDDAAHAQLLRGGACSAGGSDIGDAGNAAGQRFKTPEDSGVVPVAHVHLCAFLQHGRDPRGIGHIVHDTAHHGVLEVRVQVDEARHDSRLAEIDHFFVGIAQLEHLGRADVADDVVADKHRALLKRLGRDGKNVLCAQKHVCPANLLE